MAFNFGNSNIPTGGGDMTLIETKTITIATNEIEFTGLDMANDGIYLMLFSLKNSTGSANAVYLFGNADETLTNYYTQYLNLNDATIQSARSNGPYILSQGTADISSGSCLIQKGVDNYLQWQSFSNRVLGAGVQVRNYVGCSTSTFTNITSLKLKTSVANAFAVGSKVSLYKIGVV